MLSHPQFASYVQQKYSSYNIERWRAFMLKEKMKLLKKDLIAWNKQHFGDLSIKKEEMIHMVGMLDKKDEMGGLSTDEAKQIF